MFPPISNMSRYDYSRSDIACRGPPESLDTWKFETGNRDNVVRGIVKVQCSRLRSKWGVACCVRSAERVSQPRACVYLCKGCMPRGRETRRICRDR